MTTHVPTSYFLRDKVILDVAGKPMKPKLEDARDPNNKAFVKIITEFADPLNDAAGTDQTSGWIVDDNTIATCYHGRAEARHSEKIPTKCTVHFSGGETVSVKISYEDHLSWLRTVSKVYGKDVPATLMDEAHPHNYGEPQYKAWTAALNYSDISAVNPAALQPVNRALHTIFGSCPGDYWFVKVNVPLGYEGCGLGQLQPNVATSASTAAGVDVTIVGFVDITSLCDNAIFAPERLLQDYQFTFGPLQADPNAAAGTVRDKLKDIFGDGTSLVKSTGKASFNNGNTYVWTNASVEHAMSGGVVLYNNVPVGVLSGGWWFENRNFILPANHPWVIEMNNNGPCTE